MSISIASSCGGPKEITEPDVVDLGEPQLLGIIRGGGVEDLLAMSVDDEGNIFILCNSTGKAPFSGSYGTEMSTAITGRPTLWLFKFSNEGVYEWSKSWDRENMDCGWTDNPLYTDSVGNVYIKGVIWGSVDFDPGPGKEILGVQEFHEAIFVCQLNSGGEFEWARYFHERVDPGEYPYGVRVDIRGNTYVWASGGCDVFYPFAEEQAEINWQFDDVSIDRYTISSVLKEVDQDGNFYLAYNYFPTTTSKVLAKLDIDGKLIWDFVVDSTNISLDDVITDSIGNCYISGSFSGTVNFSHPALDEISALGETDPFLIKLDPEGNPLWVKAWSDLLWQDVDILGIDQDDKLYLRGYYHDFAGLETVFHVLTIGSRYLTAGGFICQINEDGDPVYLLGTDHPEEINREFAVDKDGAVYIAGMFDDSFALGPPFDRVIHKPAQNSDIFFLRFDAGIALDWEPPSMGKPASAQGSEPKVDDKSDPAIYIAETQLNRNPGRINLSNLTHSTFPLWFPDPVSDYGGLRLLVKVANDTDVDMTGELVPVARVSVDKYIGTRGDDFDRDEGFDSVNIYHIPANSTVSVVLNIGKIDAGLMETPVSFYSGTNWLARVKLSVPTGIFSWSVWNEIGAAWIEFDLVNDKVPVYTPPDFESDAAGNLVLPPSHIWARLEDYNNFVSLLNLSIKVAGASIGATGKSLGSAGIFTGFEQHYQDLEGVYESVTNSGSISNLSYDDTDDGDKVVHIGWLNSLGVGYTSQGPVIVPFRFDRAVVRVLLPPELVVKDPGTARFHESNNGISLVWYLNGPDKQITNIRSDGYTPVNHKLYFVLNDDHIGSYDVKTSLSLEIGPFKGYYDYSTDYRDAPWYDSLSNAPWIYDYETWSTNPQDVYWYLIGSDYKTLSLQGKGQSPSGGDGVGFLQARGASFSSVEISEYAHDRLLQGDSSSSSSLWAAHEMLGLSLDIETMNKYRPVTLLVNRDESWFALLVHEIEDGIIVRGMIYFLKYTSATCRLVGSATGSHRIDFTLEGDVNSDGYDELLVSDYLGGKGLVSNETLVVQVKNRLGTLYSSDSLHYFEDIDNDGIDELFKKIRTDAPVSEAGDVVVDRVYEWANGGYRRSYRFKTYYREKIRELEEQLREDRTQLPNFRVVEHYESYCFALLNYFR